MTKVRPPISFELALTRAAGLIGWERTARILGVAESTAYNWANPDTVPTAANSVTLALAVQLDIAYRAEGGESSPMLGCFFLQVETGLAEAFPDAIQLARRTAAAAKEAGEAIEALITASIYGASEADRVVACRETEEAITAFTSALPDLGLHCGPEVPPPPGEIA